jgi:hypothetical protein
MTMGNGHAGDCFRLGAFCMENGGFCISQTAASIYISIHVQRESLLRCQSYFAFSLY